MPTRATKERSPSAPAPRNQKNRVRGLRPSRARRIRTTGLPSYGPRWGKRFVYDGAASDQRYPGQYFDAETGLHQNYFRDYDPRTGRYIQADPIGVRGLLFGGGVYDPRTGGYAASELIFDSRQLSLFVYAGNDPVNMFDPSGLSRRSVALGMLSYALNTGALIATLTPAPVVAVPLKAGGIAASVASIVNAGYEAKIGEISWTQFRIIVGVEAANMLGNVSGTAGVLIGAAGRAGDIAITTKDAADLICPRKRNR